MDILIDYTNQKKLFDEETIVEMANILKSYYDVSNYVKAIIFDKEEKDFAYYNGDNLIMGFNLENCQLFINTIPENNVLERNLIYIEILFHEFEHVLNDKKCDTPNEELTPFECVEKDLLTFERDYRINFLPYNVKTDFMRYTYEERSAYLNSIEKVTELLEKMNCIELMEIYTLKYMNTFLERYEFLTINNQNLPISPIVHFYERFNKDEFAKKYWWYDENPEKCLKKCSKVFSFNDRMYFGFPISPKELKIPQENREIQVLKVKEKEESYCEKK